MAKRSKGEHLTTVRTTFNPSVEYEVNDRELLDLARQGLIYNGKAPASPALEPDEGTDSDVDDAADKKGAQS